MSDLNTISDGIRAAFIAKNAARDEAISRSRELIRHCAEGIRAIHRREWDKADANLAAAAEAAPAVHPTGARSAAGGRAARTAARTTRAWGATIGGLSAAPRGSAARALGRTTLSDRVRIL